jgi:hypothetical protein
MELHYLLDSESNLTVIPRSILERLAGQSLVNEVPVDVFQIGLPRSNVYRGKVKTDVAFDTRGAHVLIRDLQTFVVDASMNVLFVGDDVLQKLGISPQHLLAQKIVSG